MGKDEEGSALLTSIMVMVLVLGLTAAALTLVTGERTLVSYQMNSTQAVYLAEAGVEQAIAQLENDPNWSGVGSSNSPASLGNGQYWVTVAANGQSRTVTSTGKVGDVKKQITVTLDVENSGSGQLHPVFGNGLFAVQNITVGNNANVNGNVTSRQVVSKKNNANLNGTETNYSTLTLPELKESYYKVNGAKKFPSFSNNSNITLTGGIYFVDGPLDISNNVNIDGNGTVYVKGRLEISNNVNINGTAVAFLSTDDIELKQNANLNGGVLFSKKNIIIDNNAQVRGSVVAGGSITVDNNATIDYNSSMVNSSTIKLPGTNIFKVNTWKYD